MTNSFSQLCSPAKLYFVLVIISIIIGLFSGFHVLAIIVKLIFAFIWTMVLNWLCKKGWKTLSWILVLLPFILIVLVYVGMWRMNKSQKNMLNMMQLSTQQK
jgi:hypothetical protein